MRCNTLLTNILLAASAIAAPAEKRASVSAGISASVNSINNFGIVAAGLVSSIQSNVQILRSPANLLPGVTTFAQAQIGRELDALSTAAAALRDGLAKSLDTSVAAVGTASQSDINALDKAVPNLSSIIANIQAAQDLALSSTNKKTSDVIEDLVGASKTLITAFSDLAATIQNFGTSVRIGAGISTSQLTSNTATLVNQVAKFANGLTSALNIGNVISSSAYAGANGAADASALGRLIDGIINTINNVVSQVVSGASQVTVSLPTSLPGLTIQPNTITIPGFSLQTPIPTRSTFTLVSVTLPNLSTATFRPSSLTLLSSESTIFLSKPPFTPSISISVSASEPLISTDLPTISIPTLSLPSISVPRPSASVSISASGPSIPTDLPTLTLPTISIPTISLPSVSIPSISVPLPSGSASVSISASGPSIPTISFPSISIPTISLPTLSLPSISVPRPSISGGISISGPSIPTDLPTFTLPTISIPTIPLPTLSIPIIPIPQPSGSASVSISVSGPSIPTLTLPTISIPTIPLPTISISVPSISIPRPTASASASASVGVSAGVSASASASVSSLPTPRPISIPIPIIPLPLPLPSIGLGLGLNLGGARPTTSSRA